MTGADLFVAACGLGMIATSSVTILAAWSNSKLRCQRDEARRKAEDWQANYDRVRETMLVVNEARKAALAAEPERIEQAVVDQRRAHLRAIGIKGNQSPKRRKSVV